jgi:hypothetical protein
MVRKFRGRLPKYSHPAALTIPRAFANDMILDEIERMPLVPLFRKDLLPSCPGQVAANHERLGKTPEHASQMMRWRGTELSTPKKYCESIISPFHVGASLVTIEWVIPRRASGPSSRQNLGTRPLPNLLDRCLAPS